MKDVGVVGLGTMGSMAAWQLVRQGYSVIGFEQFGIGHDRAGAGGETRLFRTAYKEKTEYVPFLQEAQTLWRELETESGNELLTLTGGLYIGHAEDEGIRSIQQSIEQFNLEHRVLNYQQAKQEFPQHLLSEEDIMIFDKSAGFVRPELAVVSAVKRAETLGAEILPYTPVQSIEENKDSVTIRTESGEYQVRQVLVTAGPWLSRLLPEYQAKLEARKILLTWFPARDISLFKPDCFPIFTRKSGGDVFYGTPTLENSMVKVAVSKSLPIEGDPDRLNRTVEVDDIKDAAAVVSKYLPNLYPDPIRVNAYMDTFTPDGHAILGRVPSLSRTVVAGGFSGHGFKMSPVIGKLTANLIIKEEFPAALDFLSPARFKE